MPVFIFGEAMLEYHSGGSMGGLRYGGDTLNTAIHMARMGVDVAYVTAVGSDPVSDALVDAWTAEGIDTRYVLRHPSRNPGIYAIHVDETGERSFIYWRDQSAARDMFGLPKMAEALDAAKGADLLYYSLISLAILPEASRAELIKLSKDASWRGQMAAYDSNFRPKLWPSFEDAQRASDAATAASNMGLPTNVDESQLHEASLSEADIAQNWHALGCTEVVVKAGDKGCYSALYGSEGQWVAAPPLKISDASGAGDAFNAGYLTKRLKGGDVIEAINAGQSVARWVLTRSGAIPPRDDASPYDAI